MRKKSMLALVLVVFTFMFTGCGDALYRMTPEEEEIITLYAAKMVSKFNKDQTTGICNARIKEGEFDGVESPIDDLSEETIEEDLSSGIISTVDLSELNTTPSQPAEPEEPEEEDIELSSKGYNLTRSIGIDGMEFYATSFEVTDEYNADNVFVISASKGKAYVVFHIDGTNCTENDIALDMNSQDINYKLTINGSSVAAETTVLLNDLSTYEGTVGAGDTEEFILIFQFSESIVSDITSISLGIG